MAREQVITCDGPGCDKVITEGDGRGYHLMVQGTRIPIREGTHAIDTITHPTLGEIAITAHDAHDVIHQHHLCSFACLATWTERQLDDRHAAQESHKVALVDAAQLRADEIAAMPEHLRPGSVAPEPEAVEAES